MTVNLFLINNSLTFNPEKNNNLTAKRTSRIVNNNPLPFVEFSSSNFTVREDGTFVQQVMVRRTGDSANNFSVRLVLTNGTALASSDYNSTPINISFNRGGNGLDFDGVDDYVSLPATRSAGPLTVEAWVFADNVDGNLISRIFDFGNGAGSDNLTLYYEANSGKMSLANYTGSSLGKITTLEKFPENRWVHVAAVINGTGDASIYWDGEVKASGLVAPVLNVNRTNRYIGRSNWSQDAYFNGKVDDFRIWNLARTQAQIQANLPRQLNGFENGLVDYYNFNNTNQDTARDITPNANNGTIFGATTASGFLPTSIPITIPIINDVRVEEDETVNLTLTEPTGGATVGTTNTAILNIIDNDGVNLIVNGSFETGANPNQGVGLISPDAGSSAITGWTVTRGQIDYNGRYWQAADGGRSLDLNGSPGVGGIAQTFNTVIGKRYRVNFSIAGNPLGGSPVKQLAVSAANQSSNFSFDTTGYSLSDMGWEDKSWVFTANSTTTTLEFYSLSNQSANRFYGPALDKVSVVALPNPIALNVNWSGITENSAEAFVYTFTRNSFINTPLTVNFSVAGSATLNNDYTLTEAATFTGTTGTVTFNPGSTTARVVIKPINENIVEGNETVSLVLNRGSGYDIGTPSAVSGTIINDDGTRSPISTNGNDVITSNNRTGVIAGGSGKDLLIGGSGADIFDYQAPNEGLDTIRDFNPTDDLIFVRGSSFEGGLIRGTLLSEQFFIGSAATSSSQRFIYNSFTGNLLYDKDGSGITPPLQLATLNTGLNLTYENIFVS